MEEYFLDEKFTVLGENSMSAHVSTGNPVLDLFFKAGRNSGTAEVISLVAPAFYADPELTLKCLAHIRNIRGGMGERRFFRVALRWLISSKKFHAARALIPHIPFYGRWDDALVCLNSPLEKEVAAYIYTAIISGDKLAAKWMPRENKNPRIAKILRGHWGMTPREYRVFLAENTSVVETQMCDNAWGEINYPSVPSKASSVYAEAFYRHDPQRYEEFLLHGKVAAGAVFPSEVIKKVLRGNASRIVELRTENQWNNLRDIIPSGQSFIPVCDVSGSMEGEPMEVSVALGLYLSERNKGIFKDVVINFSGEPKFCRLRGSITERIAQLNAHGADWGNNTNLELVFDRILAAAKKFGAPQEEMPSAIIIISDMQFDQCCRKFDNTALEMIDRMYAESGYQRPEIIFWNVRSSVGFPAKKDARGVVMVGGYSPDVLASLFNIKSAGEREEITPEKNMLNTLLSEQYNRVVLF